MSMAKGGLTGGFAPTVPMAEEPGNAGLPLPPREEQGRREVELLGSYRWLVREKEALEAQLQELSRPMRVITHRGAAARAAEARERRTLACEQHLARMEEELSSLVAACEEVLSAVTPSRTRLVLRQYYLLGWTDERIGEVNHFSSRLANRIRNLWLAERGCRSRRPARLRDEGAEERRGFHGGEDGSGAFGAFG